VSCGNTVTGTVKLTKHLVCPTGHGLVVGNGATLDCNDKTIIGGDQSGQYGIYVRNVSTAIVQNCTVAHFEVGIRLRGAIDAIVEDNVSRDNTRYGLEITSNSTGAVIRRNDIIQNGDEGSRRPARSRALHGLSRIPWTAGLEGIYLLDSDANTVADNAIRIKARRHLSKGSHRNTIEGNTLNVPFNWWLAAQCRCQHDL
jgi:parallel beta-helix repeat protein